MPDKRLRIAAVGFQHFQAPVAGHVGDLDRLAFTAVVTKPARRLWPAKAEASSPSLAARALTMRHCERRSGDPTVGAADGAPRQRATAGHLCAARVALKRYPA